MSVSDVEHVPDLTGLSFGGLVVVGRVKGFRKRWLCQCGCGVTVERPAHALLNENRKVASKSCGCRITQRTAQTIVFTDEMKAFVRDNYARMNLYMLADHLGVSEVTLADRLPAIAKEYGFTIRHRGGGLGACATRPTFTTQQWHEFADRFNAGTPFLHLAQQHSVGVDWFVKQLRMFAAAHGITLRSTFYDSARAKRVCDLIDKGHTYTEVMGMLGNGLTRNAVAGIVHRHYAKMAKL